MLIDGEEEGRSVSFNALCINYEKYHFILFGVTYNINDTRHMCTADVYTMQSYCYKYTLNSVNCNCYNARYEMIYVK